MTCDGLWTPGGMATGGMYLGSSLESHEGWADRSGGRLWTFHPCHGGAILDAAVVTVACSIVWHRVVSSSPHRAFIVVCCFVC